MNECMEEGHTCSTTYFDAPYPMFAAVDGSVKGASGTAPFAWSQALATPMEDVMSNRMGCSEAAEMSMSLRTPAIWSSNDWSARLKFTVQAL